MSEHKQDLNTPMIVTVGLVSVLLLVVALIGVHAWFLFEQQDEIAGKWEMAPDVAMRDLKSEQQAKVNTYRWVGPGKADRRDPDR